MRIVDAQVHIWSGGKPANLHHRRAEQMLAAASRAGKPGRFQLEAAIQSAHVRRAVTGRTEWEAIALLYEGLIGCAPTIGAHVGRAAALAEAMGAEAGLAALEDAAVREFLARESERLA